MAKKNLVIDNPDLMSAWDWEKNNAEQIYPEKYASGSRQKAWWICKKGHSYQSRIAHKKEGHMCPYCSGRLAIPGETDLATLYPSIAAEWDYELNYLQIPSTIKPKCNDSAWWICPKGHKYQAAIVNRVTEGSGCPYCSNKKVLPGFNDLETVSPVLAHEWDCTNNRISPREITIGSDTPVYWLCKRGHSYLSSPSSRNRGRGCPYCCNQKLLVGFNDLATVFPEIAAEWDYSKNIGKTPQDYVYGSGSRVFWKCKKGHEWAIPIVNRTRDGNGCPVCNKAKSVSFPEKALLYYVKKLYPQAKSNYRSKDIHNREIDVYLEEYRIGIEYDGDIWHRDAFRDNEKNNYCNQAGISLIRIREPECPVLNGSSIDYYMQSHSIDEYNEGIAFALQAIIQRTGKPETIDVSINRDTQDILKTIEIEEVEKSLASVNPDLASEWHPIKNTLQPTQISANSGKRVWWLGKCGHSWPASVASRNKGSGCPVCRGLVVLKGFNDLETLYPEIATEWDFEKNKKKPSDVTAYTPKRYWWRCNLGHEYLSSPNSRTKKKNSCPYCSNHQVLIGFNDLQTTYPSLVEEWDFDKNKTLPTQVTAGKPQKVWWKCKKCGYEWKAYISNRSRGVGCPRCSNHGLFIGYNDLQTVHPLLAEEWNYEKNPKLPSQVTVYSAEKVWWKCKKCGYEWQTSVNNRSRGTGCPECAKKIKTLNLLGAQRK